MNDIIESANAKQKINMVPTIPYERLFDMNDVINFANKSLL